MTIEATLVGAMCLSKKWEMSRTSRNGRLEKFVCNLMDEAACVGAGVPAPSRREGGGAGIPYTLCTVGKLSGGSGSCILHPEPVWTLQSRVWHHETRFSHCRSADLVWSKCGCKMWRSKYMMEAGSVDEKLLRKNNAVLPQDGGP